MNKTVSNPDCLARLREDKLLEAYFRQTLRYKAVLFGAATRPGK